MRRLVFLTQRVDADDPVLGATVAQIEALARRLDEVVVVAQSARGRPPEGDVAVRTFGAPSRLARAARFERELARALRPRPVAVLAHMIPVYVLLAAPLARPRRIPLALWYTHWRAHPALRAAERLATVVVSVDRRSFPLASPKLRAVGHGIDVSQFTCAEGGGEGPLRLLVLGRYSPAKGIDTILRGVTLARERGLEVDVELHGTTGSEPERRHRLELERLGFPLGDPLPRTQLPGLLARADALVNNMRAGSPDKAVYEAAAACLPVLASNPVFDELFDGLPLAFARDDPGSLADRIEWLASLPAAERRGIGRMLRERVVARHSTESWADGIMAAVS
jgi:glycosyltransferase involved in cell wall biosynthesis